MKNSRILGDDDVCSAFLILVNVENDLSIATVVTGAVYSRLMMSQMKTYTDRNFIFG